MPTETIETPPDVTKPPQVPKTIDPKWGDKFEKALSSLTVAEPDADRDTKKSEVTPPPEPKKEEKVETPLPTEKPSSALEAALGEDSKPAETKPDLAALDKLEAELDQVTTPKSEDWKRAREARNLLRDELTKAQSAPKPVDTNVDALTKELEDYKQRVANQEKSLKALNAEYSEEFQGLLSDREKVLNKVANKMNVPPPQSKAPAPITPISGNSKVENWETMPLDEYMRREDERWANRRRH